MKVVKALINYRDLELNRSVKKDEVFEVTEERAEVLLKGNPTSGNKPFVEVIGDTEEKVEKPKRKGEKENVEVCNQEQ